MHLWWSLCTLYLHACQVRVTVGDLHLAEFMYLVFTRMPGESYSRRSTSGGVYVPCIYTHASYRGRLGSLLLYLCYVFRALINSLVY